jgi:pimeloyl-ACP methyl ester carboxylesterase
MGRIVKSILLLFLIVLIGLGLYLELNYRPDLPIEKVKKEMAFKSSKYVPFDSTDVHYIKSGKGPVLVLVHGFGGNLRNWKEWQTILSDSFTVISMDLPGYGLTGPTHSADYSDSAQVAFLAYFCDQLKLDSFYLAGNSMGGSIAWRFALQYPNKVRKLVLLDAAGYPRAAEDEDDVPIGFKVLQKPGLSKFIAKITPRSIMSATLRNTYGDPSLVTEGEVDEFMTLLLRAGNREVLIKRMQQRFSINDTTLISTIKQPALIMWGDRDNVIKVADAAKFHRDIPNSELIIYPGVGHLPMHEIPALSAEDVTKFLLKN